MDDQDGGALQGRRWGGQRGARGCSAPAFLSFRPLASTAQTTFPSMAPRLRSNRATYGMRTDTRAPAAAWPPPTRGWWPARSPRPPPPPPASCPPRRCPRCAHCRERRRPHSQRAGGPADGARNKRSPGCNVLYASNSVGPCKARIYSASRFRSHCRSHWHRA